MSTTTRSQRFCESASHDSALDFVLGRADDVDRRHLLERRDQVLADDRAVLDDERFQLGHRRVAAKAAHRPSSKGSSPQQRMDARNGHASGTPKRRVSGKAPRRDKPRSAHRLVGDFLRGVGLCVAICGLAPVRRGVRRRRGDGDPGRRLQAIHRVVRARRDPRPDARRRRPARRPQARPRQHGHPRAGAGQRRRRPLPGVHRDDRSRAAEARRQSVARRAESLARAAAVEGRGPVRLQQHLCAGDDPRESRGPRHPPHLRPVQAGGGRAHAGPLARVPPARRRLAGVAQGVRRACRRADRPRPRARLRRRRRRHAST